jgi:UDP-N-acetyl-D-mannosaminuronic acid dehydrogenase
MNSDVAIVGLGRVGLPLALSFADRGLSVVGIESDPARLDAVRERRMPFREAGAQELLDRVELTVSAEIADAARASHIVLALGTPAFSHIEVDIGVLRQVVDRLVGELRVGQSLVLRSTVPPGTTDFIAGYLRKKRGFEIGRDFYVAHAPERTSSGNFLEEIVSLPCIIGGVGTASGARAAELFQTLGAPIILTTPVQAELAKVWTNILRYATFALPNLLMMDAEQHGASVFEVIDLINCDYPRGGMAQPGLTAGSCLRKDFAFSEERSNVPGMLLAVSRVHESVPRFLIDGLQRRMGALAEARVCVLGLAFKADSDDDRDSLAHKLIRLLDRELAEVSVHDPLVTDGGVPLEEAAVGAHAVFVATNHTTFRATSTLAVIAERARPECIVVDPWNCWGAGEVYSTIGELTALTAASDGRGAADRAGGQSDNGKQVGAGSHRAGETH